MRICFSLYKKLLKKLAPPALLRIGQTKRQAGLLWQCAKFPEAAGGTRGGEMLWLQEPESPVPWEMESFSSRSPCALLSLAGEQKSLYSWESMLQTLLAARPGKRDQLRLAIAPARIRTHPAAEGACPCRRKKTASPGGPVPASRRQ